MFMFYFLVLPVELGVKVIKMQLSICMITKDNTQYWGGGCCGCSVARKRRPQILFLNIKYQKIDMCAGVLYYTSEN